MMDRPPTSTEEAFRAFIRTFGLLKRVMEPYFSQYGISDSQWGVLRALHRAQEEGDEALRLTDLGERLLIRPPSVTGVVDRLQRSGLVKRVACPTDLRVKYVRLTARGRELVRRVLQRHLEKIESIMAGLDATEQRTLNQLLGQLGSHLNSLAASNQDAGQETPANDEV